MSDLLKINVNEHTEKKNNLTYLSWAWAWAEVLKIDPMATWEAFEFDGLPLRLLPDGSAMVKVSVTIKAHTKTCWLPIMNNRNQAIKNPDAFAVNTAMVRCLTKCISMHGLGLYIYAGEDLPEDESGEKKEDKPAPKHSPIGEPKIDPARVDVLVAVADAMREAYARDDIVGAYEEYMGLTDNDEKMYVWNLLKPDSALRAAVKKHGESLKGKQ